MKRPAKIALWTGGAVLALLIVAIVSGLYIAQSDWLREKIRVRVIAEIERATGGRVEVGKFKLDWRTLTAEFDDVVLHGTEPAAVPPLLRVKTLVVGLKIVSLWKQDFDIALLRIDEPKANLLIAADGSTNVPNPKTPSRSGKSGVETILDLKIAGFALNNGFAEVHAAGQEPKVTSYDAVGRNLKTKFLYDAAAPDYRGTLTIDPLEVRYGPNRPLPVKVDLALSIEKNRLKVSSAKLDTAASHVDFSGVMESFTNPVITAQYNANVSVAELGGTLKLKSRQSGSVQLGGDARYVSAKDYLITGNLHAKDIAFAQPGLSVRNVRADSAIALDPKKIDLTGLRIAALGGDIVGQAQLRDFDEFEAKGKLAHFNVRTLAGLATRQKIPYDGALNGPFEAHGRISDKHNEHLLASTRLTVSPSGPGVPVNGLIDAQYQGAHDTIAIAPSFLALPNTRLDASGTLGQQVKVHLETRNLDDLLPALADPKTLPVSLQKNAAGALVFDGSVTGKLASPQIAGHFTGRSFAYSGQTIDSLDADLTAASSGATVTHAALAYKNQRAAFSGSVGLHNWTPEKNDPLTAGLSLQNAQIADLLVLAGQKNVPVTGVLTATAKVSGTVGDPRASADLNVVTGRIYEEPFDRLTGKVDYVNGSTQLGIFQLRAGPKQIDLKASYAHAPADFMNGKLDFQVASNRMRLSQFQNVRKYRPGVDGDVLLNASGDVLISQKKQIEIAIGTLNADLSATGVVLDGRALGDSHLTAKTQGQTLNAHLESNVAQSSIRGDGQVQLSGDYQSTAQVAFSKVDLGVVAKLFLPLKTGQNTSVAGLVEGSVKLSGPAAKPALLTAELDIPKLEVRPDPVPAAAARLGDITVRNKEPIRIAMANEIVRIESAKLIAHNTDVSVAGQVRLNNKLPLNLRIDGTLDLALAQTFNSDVTSSGTLATNATVTGSFDQPQFSGRADLKNGNVSVAGVPNGIFNANGRILFDGSRATIETLTAETGGGKLKIAGFAVFASTMAFRLDLTAAGVRVRYPEGVGSVSDAALSLTGTSERSVLAGDITINKISYNPHSDLSSILSAAQPAPTQSAETGVLAGMQFDVRIQTSPDIEFQTGLVEDLQTEADLRLRGTASNPALLGRIIIDQGNLTFLGNKYVINQGTISFYNPVKIDPVLNIDLETRARGVDVTLTITGPMTKLNVTYSSDPPLQFSDIVSLLATGKTPSDPTLAARQTDTTTQTWQQMGANALVGQAIANPVSGRLQRFFGVSKLKIDPLLPGLGGGGSSASSGSPGARVSLEQQITPNIIFDYVVNTNSTSSQLVRVEWDFSKQWSAVILREENSAFGIDFLYKKRFK
jgi:translocation and assembly module TamB